MADMKLKNCPSCPNGEAVIDFAKSPMGIRYYSVVCKECGFSTKYWCEASKQKAFDSWNARSTDSTIEAQEAEIKRLREILEDYHQLMAAFSDNKLLKAGDTKIAEQIIKVITKSQNALKGE